MDNCEKNKMLPEKLKQLREALGLPQRKVAAVLDIDTATYSKIENGEFIPSKEKIRADHYYLYLVDHDKISEVGYEPIMIQNPSAYFEDWNITPDSYLYEHV